MNRKLALAIVLAASISLVIWGFGPGQPGSSTDGGELRLFEDVSNEPGITGNCSNGLAKFGPFWADLNGDGALDLVFMDHGNGVHVYLSKGTGYELSTRSLGIPNTLQVTNFERGDRHGGACGDFDNDGDTDLFFTRGATNGEAFGIKFDELYRNQNGTFREISQKAGTANSYGRARTPMFIDYNTDGQLDLLIGNAQSKSVLYENQGDGRFQDVTSEVGLARSDGKGVRGAWADYDSDGDPDLLMVRPVRLYENRNGTFVNVTRESNLDPYTPGEAMAVAWGTTTTTVIRTFS